MAAAIYFNPRAREGSDGTAFSGAFNKVNFNPRSREGSDLNLRCVSDDNEFQSTLPRRERLSRSSSFIGGEMISIHAPAKGAT